MDFRKRRWICLVSAVLIEALLGVPYAWSVFQQPFIDKYGWTISQISTAYTSMYIFTMHCERLMRAGNDKINSECMFLREKVFRLIQQNLNEQNYFLYTKDILAEMAGVSVRSLNRSLSELKQLRLISITSGAIRLQI